MKTIFFIAFIVFTNALGCAQTSIELFNIIEKPTSTVYSEQLQALNSDNIIEDIIFGDSVNLSSIIQLKSVPIEEQLIVRIGNQNTFTYNICSDTLDLNINNTNNWYRTNKTIYITHGNLIKTDTLYGEVYTLKNGHVSQSLFFP